MHKQLLLSVLFGGMFFLPSYAEKTDTSRLEVTAHTVSATKSTLYAKGGVVVHYQESLIHADNARFDKQTHILILDGHVEMIGYKGTKEYTSHLEINTMEREVHFKELFFSSENDLWLITDEGNSSKGVYHFGKSMLSSCDIEDPLWKMYFSRSTYDTHKEYMQIYDASVYFKDLPIFYVPYLGFSTSNQRTSGLLFPLFGYTQNDGFVYEQPIYWAINESMDLEFNPQIRTNRSLGIYATYRFADSPYSSGSLRVGYFQDQNSYIEENQLNEDQHYGMEFLYDASSFIAKNLSEDFRDGLYANITLLNDIDYLNLQKTHLTHFGQVPLQESRLNYFLSNNNWYGGLNAKYFIDTRLSSNDTTLQTLPSITLHKYLDRLFIDDLTYAVELNMKHLDRKEGPTLNQYELRLPIEYTTSFFNDYLQLSLGEEIYIGKFYFGNDDTLLYDDFHYSSNLHKVAFLSDLTKMYNDYVHVLQPSLTYLKPGNESQSPASFEEILQDENGETREDLSELFSVGLPEEQIAFTLSHYLYDTSADLQFFQRVSQSYFTNRAYRWSMLYNEMAYYWKGWTFYSNIGYSFEYNRLSESSTKVTLNSERYDFTLGHTYKCDVEDENTPVTSNDLDFDFSYRYSDKVTLNGGAIYNIEENTAKLWRIGASYHEDCWSISAQLKADVLPRPADALGESAYTQEYSFMFQLNFIPFASLGSGEKPHATESY